MKKISKEVESALERLGLNEQSTNINIDKIYNWLVKEIVGRMMTFNTATNDKARLWAYHCQILNSVLSSIKRSEQVNKVLSAEINPNFAEDIKKIINNEK